ncbi:hypothetical protein HDU97_003564 [Phlyctochytrium planicorne]|nr:hypothetical protein HDU97_003564 [Phlyctochytrium planicorne]
MVPRACRSYGLRLGLLLLGLGTIASHASRQSVSSSSGEVSFSGQMLPDGRTAQITINAPPGTNYASIGFGTGMNGVLMHICWPDAGSRQIVCSDRMGQGHNLAGFDSSAQISSVAEGGVDGNGGWSVVLNRPASDVSTDSRDYIWATGSGDFYQSNDKSMDVGRHRSRGNFNTNLFDPAPVQAPPSPQTSSVETTSEPPPLTTTSESPSTQDPVPEPSTTSQEEPVPLTTTAPSIDNGPNAPKFLDVSEMSTAYPTDAVVRASGGSYVQNGSERLMDANTFVNALLSCLLSGSAMLL